MSKNLESDVKKVLEEYDKDKKYQHYKDEERLITEIFEKYEENTDEKAVLLKVCILDSFYSTNLRTLGNGGIYEVSKHIVELKIDKDLQNKSLELITKIADFKNEKSKRLIYSFATKYCFFHNRDFYIIYDKFVEQSLIEFNKKDNFYKFTKKDLKKYSEFMDIFREFKRFYGLENFNNRDLDHFLWLNGKKQKQ